MGDSHQKLLDDCTVHPNFLYSSLYLHALIVRARFARYKELVFRYAISDNCLRSYTSARRIVGIELIKKNSLHCIDGYYYETYLLLLFHVRRFFCIEIFKFSKLQNVVVDAFFFYSELSEAANNDIMWIAFFKEIILFNVTWYLQNTMYWRNHRTNFSHEFGWHLSEAFIFIFIYYEFQEITYCTHLNC